MKTETKQKGLEYLPGAADDGYGFFPVITCQIAGSPAPKVLWIVHHRRRQLRTKQQALAAAEAELAFAFRNPPLPSSPERFHDHLLQRGFSDLAEYRVANSFDEDRRSALGDEYQPAFGEEAARNDPILHAALMQMVDQQLAENDPPETRETIERLLTEGIPPSTRGG